MLYLILAAVSVVTLTVMGVFAYVSHRNIQKDYDSKLGNMKDYVEVEQVKNVKADRGLETKIGGVSDDLHSNYVKSASLANSVKTKTMQADTISSTTVQAESGVFSKGLKASALEITGSNPINAPGFYTRGPMMAEYAKSKYIDAGLVTAELAFIDLLGGSDALFGTASFGRAYGQSMDITSNLAFPNFNTYQASNTLNLQFRSPNVSYSIMNNKGNKLMTVDAEGVNTTKVSTGKMSLPGNWEIASEGVGGTNLAFNLLTQSSTVPMINLKENEVVIGNKANNVKIGLNSAFATSNMNTYLRSPMSNGNILIGDENASSVQVGPASYMPAATGDTFIRSGKSTGTGVIIGDTWANRVQIGPKSMIPDPSGNILLQPNTSNNSVTVANSAQIQLGKNTYLPYTDQSLYLRPETSDGGVFIGDSGMAKQIQIGLCNYLPDENGDSYIRPGAQGRNVFVGDIMANQVQIGRPGSINKIGESLFPNADSNIVIQPSRTDGTVFIAGAVNSLGNSKLPFADSNVYIQTQAPNKQVYIGNMAGNSYPAVEIGSTPDTRYNRVGNSYLPNPMGDVNLQPKSFANNVHIGTTNTKDVYIGNKKTYINGQLCLGTTCIDETQLQKLMALS
jgi:hypothetical protein